MLGIRVSGWRGARAGARVLSPVAPGPAPARLPRAAGARRRTSPP